MHTFRELVNIKLPTTILNQEEQGVTRKKLGRKNPSADTLEVDLWEDR